MKDFVTYFFKGAYLFFIDSNYRTLMKFFWINIFKKRYTPYHVSFNGFNIQVADFKSFIYQYQEIFFNGFYSFNSKNSSPVIYDCGANIGISSLFFSSKHPSAKIVAYEASPSVFKVLEKNIRINNISNVQLFQNAIWIKNDLLEFSEEGADAGSLYAIKNSKKIQVQAIDFLEVLNKEDKIDFIKIDIEGAENELIPHLSPAFHKIDKLFIEYHSFKNTPQKLDEILSLLKEFNFRYYIRHSNERKQPFIDNGKDENMDMQLNIFAYKISS